MTCRRSIVSRRSLPGSATTSMTTIRPPTTVNPMTATGRRSALTSAPCQPLTRTALPRSETRGRAGRASAFSGQRASATDRTSSQRAARGRHKHGTQRPGPGPRAKLQSHGLAPRTGRHRRRGRSLQLPSHPSGYPARNLIVLPCRLVGGLLASLTLFRWEPNHQNLTKHWQRAELPYAEPWRCCPGRSSSAVGAEGSNAVGGAIADASTAVVAEQDRQPGDAAALAPRTRRPSMDLPEPQGPAAIGHRLQRRRCGTSCAAPALTRLLDAADGPWREFCRARPRRCRRVTSSPSTLCCCVGCTSSSCWRSALAGSTFLGLPVTRQESGSPSRLATC
jgi:hypothetical protein